MSSSPFYENDAFSVSSLPAYTPRAQDGPHGHSGSRGSTEHIFSLKEKKNKMQASLRLFSSAPTPASLPTFLEGDKIVGSLELNIPSNEKIAGVSILIRGEIVTGPQPRDRLCFLDIPIALWSKNSGGEAPSLSGDCRLPFSVHIPKDVVLGDPGTPGTVRAYALPQTFLERGGKVSAHYHLLARITRNALFREDAELQTMFVYVPALRPDPPSPLRQLAYQENTPIPGPITDAEGWHTFPTIMIKGTVFNNRAVEVQCAFSLSKPLSYTRGSVIPCSVTYFSRDLQALNLLCTPSSINVLLHRQVRCASLPGSLRAVDDIQEGGRAVWWPVGDGPQRPDSRTFLGEIHLAKTLKPTSAISYFTLKYFVVVMPFETTGFSSADTQPLIRQEVHIATIFATVRVGR
ncbi:hypothetical protein B0H19DRAFT_1318205 [Mycena capillaripes]|nr:hypothetical protein B0H19DRAFT_1318205 [Mycena capillaripes]